MAKMKPSLVDQFTESHQESFEKYIKEISEEEDEQIRLVSKMYREFYMDEKLNQEEDESYIKGTQKIAAGIKE